MRELAMAMPAAKAPTIGDNPMAVAATALPKHVAVATTSTVPLAFHRSARVISRGAIVNTIAIKSSQNAKVRNRIQAISEGRGTTPEVTIDKITAKTTNESTSSITAELIIMLPSSELSLPISSRVLTVIAILVAV